MPITTTTELIGPERAAYYLTLNVENNRPKKPHKIREYGRDMATDRWKETGETIKFLENGRLCDGQNRMHAVILAGVTVEFRVDRGIPNDAMGAIDSGAVRSGGDTLTISGHSEGPGAQNLAATAAVHKAWIAGDLPHSMSSLSGQSRMTRLEMADYVGEHPELQHAAHYAKHVYRNLRLPVGALATAFVVTKGVDLVAAEDFFARIEDGKSDGPGDPLLTLQRRVTNDVLISGTRIHPGTALFYLFRAWNAARRGESLTKFQTGSAASGWTPIPKPL